MSWTVIMMAQAAKDLQSLDNAQRAPVAKAILKVAQNPLPANEGGYGKPLSNKSSSQLAGCCKIKLLKLGLRVVYKVVRDEGVMKVIVISVRDDNEVYQEAERRLALEEQPKH